MILHFAESKNDGYFYMKEPIAIASIYLVKKINRYSRIPIYYVI